MWLWLTIVTITCDYDHVYNYDNDHDHVYDYGSDSDHTYDSGYDHVFCYGCVYVQRRRDGYLGRKQLSLSMER